MGLTPQEYTSTGASVQERESGSLEDAAIPLNKGLLNLAKFSGDIDLSALPLYPWCVAPEEFQVVEGPGIFIKEVDYYLPVVQ